MGGSVPQALFELSQYFRQNGSIEFEIIEAEGSFTAVSKNFRHGSIIATARTMDRLDAEIIDAILSAFEVPAVYAQEAALRRVSAEHHVYAYA